MTADDTLPARLRAIVGPAHLRTHPDDLAPFETDWTRKFHGKALAVVHPGSTAEVAAVVAACAGAGVAIVPQGGNTGMSGGATPDESGRSVILATTRLNRILAVDPVTDTILVEAGCVLATVQEAARSVDRFFPLSLGAEGSCTIGGTIATNAGGTAVLRYGPMRDLVLGVEMVLPDGRVWDGLTALRKDNTGYALRNLFIGSEGTLGIVTKAVLKLLPPVTVTATAMVGVDGPAAAMELLDRLKTAAGYRLSCFEFMTGASLDLVLCHVAGVASPFAERAPAVVLLELSDLRDPDALTGLMEEELGRALADGLVHDAVVAQSVEQARSLWRLREGISEAQLRAGAVIKHDIALPLGAVPGFIAEAEGAVAAACPGVRFVVFGHLGDGNLHYNLLAPEGVTPEHFKARTPALNRVVHDLVAAHRGSISAEHGIGQLRRDELPRYKSDVEMELMRAIKALLDPAGLLNPGKLL